MAYIQKKNGKWSAQISWIDDFGKRHYKTKTTFQTKRQAQAWANEVEVDKAHKRVTDRDPVFADYFLEWAETYKMPNKSKGTQQRYVLIAKRLRESFGNRKLSQITEQMYQQFINKFGADKSHETMSKLHGSIRSCVTKAVNQNIIPINFTSDINLVYDKTKTRKVEYLSVSEIQRLVAALEDGLSPKYVSRYMVLTAIYTGMRIGEIMALTWSDINFKEQTIRINKSYDYVEGKTKEPKTESSNRTIKVSSSYLTLISQLKTNNQELVFGRPGGKPAPTSAACQKTLRNALAKEHIYKEGFHFHSLRHSHVAMLLNGGVDLYAISKRLGHKDMSITAKKYAYLIDELRQKSDDRIVNILNQL